VGGKEVKRIQNYCFIFFPRAVSASVVIIKAKSDLFLLWLKSERDRPRTRASATKVCRVAMR
jgi:hypothetical protein